MGVMLIHLAQANIARMKAPLDDPLLAVFVDQIAPINAIADSSPGFVWRLQTGEGNATYLRPYDDRILFNLSVWQTIDDLRHFVYRSAHTDPLRRRREWFESFDRPYAALWWIPAGHVPSVDEAKKRLDYLEINGPTPFAFTFKAVFPPDEAVIRATDWTAFEPCPSARES